MATDTVAFVDQITGSPTTRLNLNDGTTWGLDYRGTDMSPPPLRRAVAQTLLTDGAYIPASAYDNRTLRLRLDNLAASVDASATQIQALMRELNRPTNFLKWQPNGATHPVFFRTFRSDASRITEYPGPGTFKSLDVQLLAEPFAYGLPESLGAFLIQNNPTSGDIFAGFSGIKGDVETPLMIDFPGRAVSVPPRQSVWAIKRRPSAIDAALVGVVQAEALTLGTDAALQAVGGFSGAGNNGVRISFATAALSQRLYGNMPGAGPEIRGRYRVYARVRKSTAGDTMALQLRWGNPTGGGAVVANDAITLQATANTTIVDLGDMSVPYGADPVVDGFSGTETTPAAAWVELWASRTSGAGTLDIDLIYFLPSSDQLSLLAIPSHGDGSSPRMRWDGAAEQVFMAFGALGSTPTVESINPVGISGAGAINVAPGMFHRLWQLHDVTPGNADSMTSGTYTLAYYPRYLYVRPATT